jgi:hypothetical protein
VSAEPDGANFVGFGLVNKAPVEKNAVERIGMSSSCS